MRIISNKARHGYSNFLTSLQSIKQWFRILEMENACRKILIQYQSQVISWGCELLLTSSSCMFWPKIAMSPPITTSQTKNLSKNSKQWPEPLWIILYHFKFYVFCLYPSQTHNAQLITHPTYYALESEVYKTIPEGHVPSEEPKKVGGKSCCIQTKQKVYAWSSQNTRWDFSLNAHFNIFLRQAIWIFAQFSSWFCQMLQPW